MQLVVVLFLMFNVGVTYQATSQFMAHRITFRDKGPNQFAPGTALYEQHLATYHPNAVQRRQGVGMMPLLDTLDQPIHVPYVEELQQLGVLPLVAVVWRNCIVADLDTLTASQIRELPFVASVTPTSTAAYPLTIGDCSPPEYGTSLDMHRILGTRPLHAIGVYGAAIRIAIIDNGFRWQTMSSMQHVDVAGTYDVIYNDSNVANEPGEPGNQDGHGTIVFSILGGWQQDSLIGIAPHASYLLAKSEDMRYERRIEEDLYCAAIEWAERNGADVSSSSLGYYDFDTVEEPMQYQWLDGKTTFASTAINNAVARGMICVTAAGNAGPDDSTLITPADADSVITVGASVRSGAAWPQSSTGPTADGTTKPDLGALGANVRCQGSGGDFINASGTSMATPQIAGVAALLRQVYPDVPTWDIRQALFEACTRADPADTILGNGIPNALVAAQLLGDRFGPGIGPPSVIEVGGVKRVLAGVLSSSAATVALLIRGREDAPLQASEYETPWFSVDVPGSLFTTDTVWGRLIADSRGHQRSYPSDSTWFPILRDHSVIACGAELPSSIVSVPFSSTPSSNLNHQPNFILYPSPVRIGTSTVTVQGATASHTIQVIQTSTGSDMHCHVTPSSVTGAVLDVKGLRSGHYVVLIRMSNGEVATRTLIIH